MAGIGLGANVRFVEMFNAISLQRGCRAYVEISQQITLRFDNFTVIRIVS
jgi:hypothetical protein